MKCDRCGKDHGFVDLKHVCKECEGVRDDLLEAREAALDIVNSYSHIPAMRVACEKLQAAIAAAKV